jgi:hypothetical protein
MFVSPPLQIDRRPPDDDPYNEKVLQPDSQKIKILVEFSDGHKRPLVRTTLYVDGQVVAENKTEPFDTFTWDLSGYTQSGEHKIVVEAVDDLNLSRRRTDWRPFLVVTAHTLHWVRSSLPGWLLS